MRLVGQSARTEGERVAGRRRNEGRKRQGEEQDEDANHLRRLQSS